MISKIILLFQFVIFAFSSSFSQYKNPISKVLASDLNIIKQVADSSDKYELQIIYTKINRDENNFPLFTDYHFNVDTTRYFYPASTVKLPASILALEKLNKLNIDGVNKFTPLKIDSAYDGQSKVAFDESSESGLPSIAHYIKKILLVSDNDAFNRLYEFLGQQQLNEGLSQRGLINHKLVHRLAFGYTKEGNRNTNPFKFYNNYGSIYEQPANISHDSFELELNNTLRGKGFINSDGKLTLEPMDFSTKNFIALPTLHEILKRIMFPYVFDKTQRFNLTTKDYNFLYKYMSAFPPEVECPEYDSSHYDSYVKFFMFGDNKDPIPKHIRVFNKVGFAYGFITDVAYIVDFKNRIEFMISATLHVNKNKIYNDGVYEYEEIGIPFLAELGRSIYNTELKRERKYAPDLRRLIFNYSIID